MLATQTTAPARPLRAALALTGLTLAATLVSALLIGWLAPGLEPMQQRFVAVLALAAFACIFVAATSRQLFTAGRLHPVLLIVPLLVVLAPFAAGIKDVGVPTGTMFVLGYLATGVYEEFWFRGLVLKSLAAWTPVRAALLSSALFGITHLANIAFGADPAITAAQVVGAACFGGGLAALRLRGVSLWPLTILHALSDMALAMGDVSGAWRWTLMIAGHTFLLIFGLLILRGTTPARAGHS
ncbi:hypothetical protein B5P43_31370 [Bacillus sp. SRB_336]|nr:hypothetical protein B5P43_31370 [Bacillus sp. SRB_336]